ncbi:uncharacterized protein F4807DRAFT_222366 [Annulohypoxylon truncatum]|uniref:uncharacterized protein n=1 Tax=Annulohypoxylon truncatum TaxID=327061 RepID=UPI002007D7FE|nr:uncharacterized protein F4807DRAFT_222366 [Annulohypoxylon truncatum]KAI1206755.1 hypothetical protein F4807DRAFT_222366 [Annulohypoxylon truncatum]
MGNFEPLMSFNLPELLAVDLEASKEVFKSRQLTAGAPAPTLADDGSKRRYSLQDSSLSAAPSSLSYHLDMMSRAKSLQNAHEKEAQFLTIHRKSEQNNSDSDTTSSESSGVLMPPPSIGTRDASIATAATSVTSERMESSNQLKLVIQDKKQAGESWIDFDADDATSPDRRYSSMINIPPPAHYLRRDMDESRSMSLNSALPRPKSTAIPPTSPASVKSLGTPEQQTYVKKPLSSPTSIPTRRSSLLYRNYPVLPQINVSPSRQSSPPRPPPPTHSDAGPATPDINMSSSARPRAFRSEVNVNVSDAADEADDRVDFPSDFTMVANEGGRVSRAGSTQYPEIAPAGIDVESWLESSVDNFPYYARTGADGGHAPLPLPPEVIDTLRVSIACFPETMLQCSSLSIETIRGHSRKLRYKDTSPASLYSETTVSADTLEPAKQSKWKWLPLKKLPSSPTQTPPSPQRSGLGESLESRFSPTWPRKPDWTAIQNLFPTSSDYLCDALYAHIVAYNYITSLCPRSVLANPISRPSSKSSAMSDMSLDLSMDLRTSIDMRSSTSDGTAIPLKAASLLGLQEDPNAPIPEPPSSRCNTLRSKRSFFVLPKSASFHESIRPPTAAGFGGRRPTPPDHSEQLLRDLRLGLARCISRLVATLRMSNGGPSAGTDSGGKPRREEDPDFMRALCEIVRLSEERYMF